MAQFSDTFPNFYAALKDAMARVDLSVHDPEISVYSAQELDAFARAEHDVQRMTPEEIVRLFDGDEEGEVDAALANRYPATSELITRTIGGPDYTYAGDTRLCDF